MKIESSDSAKDNNPNATNENKLHLINCHFHEDHHNIPVDDYLKYQLESSNNDSNNLSISFRGRPMNGKLCELPENYSFSMIEQQQNKSSNDRQKVVMKQLTNKAHYWNLDKLPSDNDSLPQTIKWINFAEDIHSHVQLDD